LISHQVGIKDTASQAIQNGKGKKFPLQSLPNPFSHHRHVPRTNEFIAQKFSIFHLISIGNKV